MLLPKARPLNATSSQHRVAVPGVCLPNMVPQSIIDYLSFCGQSTNKDCRRLYRVQPHHI